ncbi:Heat shock protein sti1 [Neolecta irregularis DAH-3]|uniref:Heat shock protein sti1 n=1 Tax=Neolecta irregularis (strain DAH-3) TaxID=1198029 RepID=A0A1U7LLK7_NEOID|nr:Heat shock protein sti1 [Neolecta irregularis DAH-3]|eukprot:OLL23529.1 Heat shock protein sti1 [Neolecta irregularis DAH-3]
MAEALKQQGNAAFAAKEFPRAIEFFTQAIEIDSQNHVLYSNRSACYASQKEWQQAVEDAEKAIQIKPDWGKGWSRKASALHGLGDLVGAKDSYEEGLKVDSTNAQLKAGLEAVNDAIQKEAQEDGIDADMGLGKMFADPNLFGRIAANPKLAPLLADSDFMNKLRRVQQNPKLIQQEMRDPRMMSVLGMLLGVDIQTPDIPMPDVTPIPSTETSSKEDSKKQPEREPEHIDEDSKDELENKKKAEAEKALGNAAYKSRNFDEAIQHYTAAYDIHKEMTYLTNLAAVYFEQEEYQTCIETCERAIEEGREVRTDFRTMAKALGRIGSAYMKQNDFDKAIKYFNKSLTEHRTPDILSKLRDAERLKKDAEVAAYINPEEAEKARIQGNEQFKKGDFVGSVKSYTEMVKRAPQDARAYGNRAASYIKLAAMPDALKDAETAISIDPTFVKAYIRKVSALLGMREYAKAQAALAEARQADTEGNHTGELNSLEQKIIMAMYGPAEGGSEADVQERIERDPELSRILADPVMRSILEQARNDPAALNEHMKNPMIREKIMRLVSAGVIKTR